MAAPKELVSLMPGRGGCRVGLPAEVEYRTVKNLLTLVGCQIETVVPAQGPAEEEKFWGSQFPSMLIGGGILPANLRGPCRSHQYCT